MLSLLCIIVILIIMDNSVLQYVEGSSVIGEYLKLTEGFDTYSKSDKRSKKSLDNASPSEMHTSPKQTFCESNEDDKEDLEKKCSILLNGVKCVTGDMTGPSYENRHVNKETPGDDYWYYKNKCYGKKCP